MSRMSTKKLKICSIFAWIVLCLGLSSVSFAAPIKDDATKAKGSANQFGKEMATHNWSANESSRAVRDESAAKVVPVECKRPKGKFPWNFEKAKIEDVVDQVSRLTCKNFILTNDIRANHTVSMVSRVPVTVDQAWQAFMSMLEANNLALVQSGKYNKIVERRSAIQKPIPVVDEKGKLRDDEGMVTYLYEMQHIGKDIGYNLVKGLVDTKQGQVLMVGDSFMVISDGASNIRRIMSILDKIDIQGAANRIKVVKLVHAEAQQVQTKLNEIFETQSKGRRSSYRRSRSSAKNASSEGAGISVQKIVADERTNKLIVIASDKAFDRIREMIDVLDTPSSDVSTQGQIYVYDIKNGTAKEISTTLTTLIQGNSNAARRGPRGTRPRGDNELFEGDIRVTANEATNALVVVASPRDYRSLLKVIARLDRPRTQVYVEAAILDISLTDNTDLGLNTFVGVPGGGIGGGLASSPDGMGLLSGIASLAMGGAQGLASGLSGLTSAMGTFNFVGHPTGTIPGINVPIPSFGVVLKALQTNANIDVLSTPSLMTLDNQKAEMAVGEKVPTLSGASTIGGTNGIPIQNITYQDVNLKFAITPRVNDENMVRLEIEQDVNELGEKEIILNQEQHHIRTKSAKTTVSVRDKQTVVIGGLISQYVQETESKIPVLGDLPVLGYLFGKTKDKKIVKKNLLLVLTPHVIRSEADLQAIYEQKMKDREEFGRLYFGDKITKYDPRVDYSKKSGPVEKMIEQVEVELDRVENGGAGSPGETVIRVEERLVGQKPESVSKEAVGETVKQATPEPKDAARQPQIPDNEIGYTISGTTPRPAPEPEVLNSPGSNPQLPPPPPTEEELLEELEELEEADLLPFDGFELPPPIME